ncbi:MAG TPA: hypothetical protein VK203_04380 [Nostocaceae cyanobacterium]|nr:hypothetical protein [Nostocaceae cyanobacterium]
MPNLKLEDLDKSPISFDLTEEDIKSIKGGTVSKPLPTCPFPIQIYIIRIAPAPIDLEP